MKKVLLFALLLVVASSMSFAQSAKERQEWMKASKKELNAKASKLARREAKKMEKEGWTVPFGALPLEKQLDRAYLMEDEMDENLNRKYIIGSGISVGEHYDAAKMQAMELARLDLAGKISSEVAASGIGSIGNRQAEDITSLVETKMGTKTLIVQSLSRVVVVTECYRTRDDGKKEVQLRIACNGKIAIDQAKQVIRKELENDCEELHKELDNILDRK